MDKKRRPKAFFALVLVGLLAVFSLGYFSGHFKNLEIPLPRAQSKSPAPILGAVPRPAAEAAEKSSGVGAPAENSAPEKAAPAANGAAGEEIPQEDPPWAKKAAPLASFGENGWVLKFRYEKPVAEGGDLFRLIDVENAPAAFAGLKPSKIYFSSPKELVVETGVDGGRELEALLLKAPLKISWSGKLAGTVLKGEEIPAPAAGRNPYPRATSGEMRIIRRGGGVPGFGDLVLDDFPAEGGGLSELSLPPLMTGVRAHRAGESLILDLEFSREMTAYEGAKEKDFPLTDLGVSIEPDLAYRARWRGPGKLSVTADLERDRDYQEKVMDREFKIALAGLKSLNGEDFGGSSFYHAPETRVLADGAFVPDYFRLLEFRQTGFRDDGKLEFGVFFNRDVDPAALRSFLKLAIVSKEEGGASVPIQAGVLSGDKGSEPGKVFLFPAEVRNGDILQAELDKLPPARGAGLLSAAAEVAAANYFEALSAGGIQADPFFPYGLYFEIRFSDPLETTDPENYISLSPAIPFAVEEVDRSVFRVRADFPYGGETVLTLKKGLRAQNGVLAEDLSFKGLPDPDLFTRLEFDSPGGYVTGSLPDAPATARIRGMNAQKALVEVWRVYENNLPFILNTESFGPDLRAGLVSRFSKAAAAKVAEVDAPPGEPFERLLRLDDFLGDDLKGVFLFRISPLKENGKGGLEIPGSGMVYDGTPAPLNVYDYFENPGRYLPVVKTDLGLSVRGTKTDTSLWAVSLSTGLPVQRATVRFYDQANQIVVSGETDGNGLFQAKAGIDALEYATVSIYDDLSYLAFQKRPGRTSSGPVEGRHLVDLLPGPGGYRPLEDTGEPFSADPYQVGIFSPRDVWRPGESPAFKGILRGRDFLPPPELFPLVYEIRDPVGKIIRDGRLDLSPEGSFDFAFDLSPSAGSGYYSAMIKIPGKEEPVSSFSFSVMDFKPLRLKVLVEGERELVSGALEPLKLTAQAAYLFGESGAGLDYEYDLIAAGTSPSFSGYEGYDFLNSPALSDFRLESAEGSGAFDEKGEAFFEFPLNAAAAVAPQAAELFFSLSVRDPGGRLAGGGKRTPWYPYGILVGVKAPESLSLGEKYEARAAALDPLTGKAVERSLECRIFKLSRKSFETVRYGRIYRDFVQERTRVSESVLKVPAGGGGDPPDSSPSAALSFVFSSTGEYLLSLSDPETGLVYEKPVRVFGMDLEAPESVPEETVLVTLDKASYKEGEDFTARLVPPFPGLLLFTLENEGLLHQEVLSAEDGPLEVTLPVPKGLYANVYAAATLVGKVEAGSGSLWAQGAASIEADRQVNALSILDDLPERIKPAAKIPVEIRVSDFEGRPVEAELSVFLVDEGILSLTGFKNLDPLDFFYRSRALSTLVYDVYHDLIPLERPVFEFLRPGGSDELSAYLSPRFEDQDRLSLFLATLKTDSQGTVRAELEIPEYAGSARFSVLAHAGRKFALKEKSVAVRRDLVLETSLPRVAAPGDLFAADLRLFDSSGGKASAGRLVLEAFGPLRIVSVEPLREGSGAGAPGSAPAAAGSAPAAAAEPIAVDFRTDADGRARFTARLAAGAPDSSRPQTGAAVLRATVSAGTEEFGVESRIPSRSPYPTESLFSGGRLPGGASEIPFRRGELLDLREAVLSVHPFPAEGLARAADFLRDGDPRDLEGTLSRGLRFFAFDPDGSGFSAREGEDPERGLKAAVDVLMTLQIRGGGFVRGRGEGRPDPWQSVYAAHFLTLAAGRTELPKGSLENALSYLESLLDSEFYGEDADEAIYLESAKAYALYVLALNGRFEDARVNALLEREPALTPSGLLFLYAARAARLGNPEPLLELFQKNVDWNRNDLGSRPTTFESPERTLALKLLLLSEMDPENPLNAQMAEDLSRGGGEGRWRNAQENAFALLALSSFLEKTASSASYVFSVKGPDGSLIGRGDGSKVFTWGTEVLSGLPAGDLEFLVEGEGAPWYSLILKGTPSTPPKPGGAGLKLSSVWRIPGGARKFDFDGAPELVTLKKGERARVEVTCQAQRDLGPLVFSELFPGGLEFESLEDEGSSFAYEVRDDRILFTEPGLSQGGECFHAYVLRAAVPGEYALPPFRAEGAYDPEVFAVLPGARLLVSE
ncbi:MAG: hypothetical protein LBR53_10980 [Deltaproteobacteria bacterium]|nr:hypothetical protein [Deltaproteobacteria bacterium]